MAFIRIYKFQYFSITPLLFSGDAPELSLYQNSTQVVISVDRLCRKINTEKMTTAFNTNRRSIVMQLVVEALSQACGEMRHSSCLLKPSLAIVLKVMSFLHVVARCAAQF